MAKEKSMQSKKPSSLKRVVVKKPEREKGKKGWHRTIAQKLRKYEVMAEGHEFLPALMHLLKRYCSDLPKNKKNPLDLEIAKALDQIPKAKKMLEIALKRHEGIPRELKRRVFSPKYLDLNIDQEIDTAQMANIIQAALALEHRTVRDLIPRPFKPWVLPQKQDCCCCCCCKTAPQPPPPQPPPPPPNKYEVTFSNLYCVDESDPEWAGSDEPYVVFGVITEEMAESGTPAWGFHTPVYEDVDDGDRRPKTGDQNLRLYGYTGARAIDSSVLITATCFEHDLGDVSDITDAVRTALTAVATTAAKAGGTVGWIVAGVAVIGIGVAYLVDLIGADDQINSSIALTLTEADADARTSSVNPYVFPALHFDGGDDDGIYDVYLKLQRQ